MNLGKTKFFLSELDSQTKFFEFLNHECAFEVHIYIAPLIVAPVLQQQQQSNRKLRTDYANYNKIMMVD